jgi:hypothetical protein
MVDQAGAQTKLNIGIIGIFLGEGFENRQGLEVLVLVEKREGPLAFRLVVIVGAGLSGRIRCAIQTDKYCYSKNVGCGHSPSGRKAVEV